MFLFFDLSLSSISLSPPLSLFSPLHPPHPSEAREVALSCDDLSSFQTLASSPFASVPSFWTPILRSCCLSSLSLPSPSSETEKEGKGNEEEEEKGEKEGKEEEWNELKGEVVLRLLVDSLGGKGALAVINSLSTPGTDSLFLFISLSSPRPSPFFSHFSVLLTSRS